MPYRLQIIIILGIILSLIILTRLVVKKRLEMKYALVWYGSGFILLIFVCFPKFMSYLTDLLGIELPVNMVFFMGFILVLAIVMTLTIAISRASEKAKTLAQMVALLEERIERIEKEKEE